MTKALKVIIADDESIIREGIAQSVNWEKLGLQLVAEAEDGEEALELALKHTADMMLVDLSMPIMNGLELIKQLKDKLPKCKVSIITGHDEFAYAQEAIKLDVEEYILKPVDPKHLEETLLAMTNKIERERVHEKLFEQASYQIDKNLHVLRERFGQEWIRGEVEEDALQEQLQFLKLPVDAPQQLSLMSWDTEQPLRIHSERDKQLIRYAIENIVHEYMYKQDERYYMFRDERNDFIIINYLWSEGAWFEDIAELVRHYLKIELKICSIPLFYGVNSIQQAYIEAKNELHLTQKLTPIIKQAKHIIDEKYWESSLSLEKLAVQLNVTSVYLSRLFKQELGLNFVQYLTYVRMKHARHLLKQSSLSIQEIALQVGYDTQHYFSTAFRKMVGVSPNQFRKQSYSLLASGAPSKEK